MTGPFSVGVQHVLPQHAMTALVHRLTRCRTAWVKNLLIANFCRLYRIDVAEAEETEDTAYPTFNDFFTRALRPGARPVDPDPEALLSPVDGCVSQIGRIRDGLLLQAKAHEYSVAALLGGADADAARFSDGSFATLYLAPHNYHRVHMPCAARLLHMRYVPGRLFSVNEAGVAGIDNLFARNERVVCEFEGPGYMVMCLVGALFVGSMETVWHGAVTPARTRAITEFAYRGDATPRELPRGAEMGRFNMGSTVILLFEPGQVAWDRELVPGAEVRVGRRIGRTVYPERSE